jgi:glycosyltransferase involved in cell wall biosynthesis
VNISVAVIAYNAEDTILSTLDSILNQDYGAYRIDLVISDDASTDATVEAVKKWLIKYGACFYSARLLENESNIGVSANYNLACKGCTEEWIKLIAADDLLLEGCLTSNVEYIRREPSAKIVFSYMEWFGSVKRITPSASQLSFFELDAKRQNHLFRYFSFNVAPTQFIKSSLLKDIGYADERYRLMEDLPLWLKITEHGVPLHFNGVVTVKYRVGDSVSKTTERFINRDFVKCCLLLNKEGKLEEFPSLGFLLKMEEQLIIRYKLFLSYALGNRKKPLHSFLFNLIWFAAPLNFFHRARERMLQAREPT